MISLAGTMRCLIFTSIVLAAFHYAFGQESERTEDIFFNKRTLKSQDSTTCIQDTSNLVWVVIILIYSFLVVLFVILLVIIHKQHKTIANMNCMIEMQDPSSTAISIPLESVTSPSSSPANDGYELVDQIMIPEHQLPHINNTQPTTAITTTYDNNQQCNTEHVSTSETAERIGGRNGLSSYYNKAHDPEDDTPGQQSNDRAGSRAYPVEVPASTYYQELVPEPRNSQGFYQQLCSVTRKEPDYASLGVSAVQDYQGLNRSVGVETNDIGDCSA